MNTGRWLKSSVARDLLDSASIALGQRGRDEVQLDGALILSGKIMSHVQGIFLSYHMDINRLFSFLTWPPQLRLKSPSTLCPSDRDELAAMNSAIGQLIGI